MSDGYIPEGKPIEQPGSSTLLQCEVTCARNPNCKAYAFRTAKPACFFYSEVYLDGTPESRELGYRTGLSILPKPGLVSAFKHGSFPPLPIPLQQQQKRDKDGRWALEEITFIPVPEPLLFFIYAMYP